MAVLAFVVQILMRQGKTMSAKTAKESSVKVKAGKPRARSGLTEAAVQAYVADRASALNASIKRARSEDSRGVHSNRTVKDIAAMAKKHRTKAGRAAR